MEQLRENRFYWVILHTLTIIGTIGALIGGLRIATLDYPWVMRFATILPQGDMHTYHSLFGGVGFASFVGLMLLSLERRGWWLFGVKILGAISITIASISGIALYYFGDRFNLSIIHFYSSLVFMVYLFLHTISYGFKRFFKLTVALKSPSRPDKRVKIALATTVILSGAFWLLIGNSSTTPLRVKTISDAIPIIIDGIDNEDVWKSIKPVKIYAHGGANFFDGSTVIKVKALKNSKNFYIYIEWKDPTKSLLHLPLIKTKDGWRVKENGFYNYDELKYYEDKLALLLSNDCTMGSGKSTHLGHKPLSSYPANWHKRGYHYTTDGTIRDMWHWKALRSDPMRVADDDFFGAPAKRLNGKRRYKAGYIADGKESGGVSMNWTWYTPNGVTPKRIHTKDTKKPPPTKAVHWYNFQEYKEDRDDYKVGQMMPSVLLKANTIEGDQADVKAKGIWSDGWWHLEMVRALDTKSKNDLPIKSGVCIWISAFDHVQVRHTRHSRPLKLEF